MTTRKPTTKKASAGLNEKDWGRIRTALAYIANMADSDAGDALLAKWSAYHHNRARAYRRTLAKVKARGRGKK